VSHLHGVQATLSTRLYLILNICSLILSCLFLPGRTFLFWIGPIPAVFSTDLQLIKQVLADRTGLYQKDFLIPVLNSLFGNGVVFINGDDWKRHRKVVLPAFSHEKIKVRSRTPPPTSHIPISMQYVTAG
jgi:hypothetical protein